MTSASDHDGGAMPGDGASVGLPAALEAEGLSKSFFGRKVLDSVDLTIAANEVHALVGPNGAGKSTLVKILAGYYEAGEGAGLLRIGGVEASMAADVSEMTDLGVRVVHQDLGLIEGLDILENVAAGHGFVRRRSKLIDWRATEQRVRDALVLVGVSRHPRELLDELAVWERVGVGFARGLYGGLGSVRLLVLDEITASLPRDEVALVLDIVRRLKRMGSGILYVSHRFDEVFEIADRVTVLRDGRVVTSRAKEALSPDELVSLVAGDQMTTSIPVKRKVETTGPRLEMRDVKTLRLSDISLTVRGGEICGVIGRAGCGRSALGRTLIGTEKVTGGTITVNGCRLAGGVRGALGLGVAYVPQDRLQSGVLAGGLLRENLSLTSLPQISTLGWLHVQRERALGRQLMSAYAIHPPDTEAPIETLSGGNQQKVVVARWAPRDCSLFVLDEPTEGVDVSARNHIYSFVREQAAAGAGVLLLSSSIEEIVQLADRAIFLADGRIVESLEGSRLVVAEIERLLLLGSAQPRWTDSEEQASADTSP